MGISVFETSNSNTELIFYKKITLIIVIAYPSYISIKQVSKLRKYSIIICKKVETAIASNVSGH